VLDDPVQGVSDQADGQGQGQFAPAGLVEEAGGETASDRMQLQLRSGPSTPGAGARRWWTGRGSRRDRR
jgi:hypothetical protein